MASKKWTEEDDAVVMKFYPVMEAKEVGKMIGRTASAVTHRAFKIGAKKTREYLEAKKEKQVERMRNWVL